MAPLPHTDIEQTRAPDVLKQLQQAATRHTSKAQPAVKSPFTGLSVTYADLMTTAGTLQPLLAERVSDGGRVGVFMSEDAAGLVGVLAALLADKVVVPLDPAWDDDFAQEVLAAAGVEALVHSSPAYDSVGWMTNFVGVKLSAEGRVRDLGVTQDRWRATPDFETPDACMAVYDADLRMNEVSREGLSRSVFHLYAGAPAASTVLSLHSPASLHGVWALFGCLVGGHTWSAVPRPDSVDAALALVERSEAAVLDASSGQLRAVQRPLPAHVALTVCQGLPPGRETAQALRCRELRVAYGVQQTQGCFAVGTVSPDSDARCIGLPVAGVAAHIVTPEGRPIAAGMPGELCFTGAQMVIREGRVAKSAKEDARIRQQRLERKAVLNDFKKRATRLNRLQALQHNSDTESDEEEDEYADPTIVKAPDGRSLRRTGLRCRWSADGELEVLGRVDDVRVRPTAADQDWRRRPVDGAATRRELAKLGRQCAVVEARRALDGSVVTVAYVDETRRAELVNPPDIILPAAAARRPVLAKPSERSPAATQLRQTVERVFPAMADFDDDTSLLAMGANEFDLLAIAKALKVSIAQLAKAPSVRAQVAYKAEKDKFSAIATEKTDVEEVPDIGGAPLSVGMQRAAALFWILVVASALSVGALPAALVADGLGGGAARSGMAFFLLFLALLGQGAVGVLLKWLLVGRYRPSRVQVGSALYLRHWAAALALKPLRALWDLTAGTRLVTLSLRALGASVSSAATVYSSRISEFDLVSIGAGAVVEAAVALRPRTRDELRPITVGPQVTIDPLCVVAGGATLMDRSHLGPRSALASGRRVPASTTWAGAPAEYAPAAADTAYSVPLGHFAVDAVSFFCELSVFVVTSLAFAPALLLPGILGPIIGAGGLVGTAAGVAAGAALGFALVLVPATALARKLLYRPEHTWAHWAADRLMLSPFLAAALRAVAHTPLSRLCYKLLGVSIARNSRVGALWLRADCPLLHVGRNCVVADGVAALAQRGAAGAEPPPVRIQDGVHVGNSALLLPGGEARDNARLPPAARLQPSAVASMEDLWAGATTSSEDARGETWGAALCQLLTLLLLLPVLAAPAAGLAAVVADVLGGSFALAALLGGPLLLALALVQLLLSAVLVRLCARRRRHVLSLVQGACELAAGHWLRGSALMPVYCNAVLGADVDASAVLEAPPPLATSRLVVAEGAVVESDARLDSLVMPRASGPVCIGPNVRVGVGAVVVGSTVTVERDVGALEVAAECLPVDSGAPAAGDPLQALLAAADAAGLGKTRAVSVAGANPMMAGANPMLGTSGGGGGIGGENPMNQV